jgi:hypothetical protein
MAKWNSRTLDERTFAPKLVDRFWAKVGRVPEPGRCWPWRGYFTPLGVPVAKIYRGGRTVNSTPRQVAFTLHHRKSPIGRVYHEGAEPEGVHCCNPAHLRDTGDPTGGWQTDLGVLRATRVAQDAETGCWIWQGRLRSPDGEPICKTSKTSYVRRLVWELDRGEPPDRRHTIETSCRREGCVSPAHLTKRRFVQPPRIPDTAVRAMRRAAIETGAPRGFVTSQAEEHGIGASTVSKILDHERR